MATKQKKAGNKVAVFALIEPEQKAALEEIGKQDQRSLGYLVREAIAHYLASAKKKP
jgi:predicted transcriptional regulator